MAEAALQVYRPTDVLAEKSTFEIMPMAFQLADKLSQTDFVPIALRNKPAAVAACILYGHEVGMPPMASLQHINVIQGKPGLSAAGQRALILANGHRIWIEESTNTRAVVCSQRRGEERVLTTTWTMDDAKRAKLEHKDVWQTYPRNMLVARATGDNARGNFMDVLIGMPYNAEELQDMTGAELGTAPDTEAPAPPAKGTVRRRALRAATAAAEQNEPPPGPDPAADDVASQPAPEDPPPAPEPEPATTPAQPAPAFAGEHSVLDVQTMTLAQQVAMECREANIDRPRLILAITGKEKARDLTRPEAVDVLEQAKAIHRGEARLVEVDGKWIVEPVQARLL